MANPENNTFDSQIASAKQRLVGVEQKIDDKRSTKDTIVQVLGGSENRAYQKGAGGRGLMGVTIDTAQKCHELGVEMSINVNFAKASVQTLERRQYSLESDIANLERERQDIFRSITELETEKRLSMRYAAPPAPVQLPPVQLPPRQPSWLVLNEDGTDTFAFEGQDLAPETLVTNDRGQTWISALDAGLAEAPVQLPPKKGK